ncbi:MAG: uroporphyrinogen-III synthase, partial [Methyloligellaceae bacterium]
MRFLITRPEPDAAKLARRLEAKGHEAVVEPLLTIFYPDHLDLPFDGAQALIFTSRNGVRALAKAGVPAEALRLPVLAVGEATAGLARDLGFSEIHIGRGTAADLVPVAEAHCDPDTGALLHLAGAHVASNMKPALLQRGFTILQETVYEAVAATELSAGLQDDIRAGRLHGILFMSPRTAAVFLELVALHGLKDEASRIACFCLSNAIAAKLAAGGIQR